jgi:hypothetical protein
LHAIAFDQLFAAWAHRPAVFIQGISIIFIGGGQLTKLSSAHPYGL